MSAIEASKQKIRVMCVDDHAFLVEGLKSRLLAEPDLEFAGSLHNLERVAEEAQRLKASIVLVDIEIPGPDVFEVILDLARRCPTVRPIVLSAYVRDHYIDSAREGRKVFQDELLGTLFTVAKDVKLQIEFNPQHAAQYRLIGYNNRMLAKEDFANDKVDAGDIGAGHRVTALYEVIPVGAPGASSIPLKYGQPAATEKPAEAKPLNPELLTVKLRYKEPTADVSQPFDVPFVEDTKAQPSVDLTFAATVAEFGERLQGHTAPGRTIDQLIEAAEAARRDDPHGHRAEFIELMRKSGR